MPISESMVQDIVQEVMAKMQIADAPAGKHGIFTDMNEAIEACVMLTETHTVGSTRATAQAATKERMLQ